jgi:hypothetical protein
MGDIGPTRQRFDVLPGESFGIEDADAWTVPSHATVPVPPDPGPSPVPDPGPTPSPEPLPHPEPPR